MKTNGIILKGIGSILLALILYMHLCSTICATGVSICCDIEDDADHHKKECCSHDENSESKDNNSKDNNCQDIHSVFFGVTGQFAQAKADISLKAFQLLVTVITPLFIFQPVEENKNLFAYNGFHPPPPTADIRILLQSFQI